jgi:L-alanine-DL-glutamate epimerase-like enolase superfamily enzyme
LHLSLHPYQLQFKFPFRISHGLRTLTDAVYVKLEHEGLVGWGEAALPPYLPETQKSVIEFLTTFSASLSSNSLDDWFEKLEPESKNMCAKAALDMALWDLKSQLEKKSVGELLGIEPKEARLNTFTIGISSFSEMQQKVREADKYGFGMFKIKLDGQNDEEMISNFKKLSAKPFAVDVNEGWSNVAEAADKISWLEEEGCFFIEQPLRKDALDEMKLLKGKSSLPLYADESCQRLNDIERLGDCFDGINIKLMKCGGITEAHQMALKANALGLEILIGCMSESSVGCTAAAHLAPLANFTDLDGPYLITNDPFDGITTEFGSVEMHPLKSKGLIS